MLFAALACVVAACSDEEPSRVERLLVALERNDPEARGLDELGPDDAGAVPAITAMLARDERRYVQLRLVRALGAIRHRDALPALERALRHPDAVVRAEAAAAHWSISGERDPGLDVLLALLAGPRPGRGFALAALSGLEELPARELAPELAAALERGVPEAADALVLLGPDAEAALPAVRAAADQRDDLRLRAAAAHALYRLGGDPDHALELLLADLPDVPPMARARYHEAVRDIARGRPDDVVAAVERHLLAPGAPEETRRLGRKVLDELGLADAEEDR